MRLSLPQSVELKPVLLLSLIIGISFFAGLGSAPLFDVDEGAFSEATREMLVSGNYLTTYLNGMPRFDKPILIYWLQALSVTAFGLNEFAFRFPSAAASAIWAGTIYLFIRKELGSVTALLASIFMVLSLQVTIIAKAAIADGLLNCCLAVTMFAIYTHFKTGSSASRYLAFAAAGLGVLTKGPVAIVIPGVVSLLFFLQQGMMKQWLKTVTNLPAIAIFFCIVLPWYTLEYLDQGMAFIDGFLFKHNVNRFSSSLEGHSGSLVYYVPVVLAGLMPFTGLLFTLLFNLKKLLGDPLNRYLCIWFAFVFVFFSLSGTKLPHYMIYGYTPLFILMARALPHAKYERLLALWPALFLLFFAALPLLIPVAESTIDDIYILAVLRSAISLTGTTHMVILAAAALATAAIPFVPGIPPVGRAAATGIILCLSVNFYLMPLAARLLQEPVRDAALLSKAKGYKVVMWKVYYPSFLLYSQSFAEKRVPKKGEIVLTTVKYLERLDNPEVLFSRHGIVLLKHYDMKPRQ
ncbi:MAG: glycosyltransferase family 39 protein [Chlorobium sp.]|uniref:ArnT family glycosyltransferase n=1 Tax=Chlorobium sp. TaxID=1095 RepID=UPI0025BED11A|nr:glycosyltransferase family 39 protein [Chlorobium sp.]MCF8215917.1 glycosyltransferase family 39 protein [Chlorobium sp.]MCF8270815.1 glycosyltransferase family 39 protein [Chlorobium sp.]MCF8287127.1 glycosyltransferase family 39 protein [Chlorobium sp.]MCF8290784.1 glycosyltransferase family 39 protein [Chlorobium sp.]MCF8384888.1 glycosyltransferase family 39 protein [Chlorobium sp.]